VPAASGESPYPAGRTRYLAALKGYLAALRQMPRYSLAELAADQRKLWAVERGLQLAAQSLLDLGHHLLAGRGIAAGSYHETIELLGAHGLIPRQFAEDLRWVAALREALIHGYLNVEVEQVHQAFTAGLDQMARFAEYAQQRLGVGGAP
jgi:uncharacterized protein YutE (UPF0331/DUF86 family)